MEALGITAAAVLACGAVSASEADELRMDDAVVTELTVSLDGSDIKVTEYEDLYLKNTTIEDQKISIYVPEGANADSPIILCVNNSGWMANSYSSRTQVIDKNAEKPKEYSSTDDKDKVGKILSKNYVLVSYGCRSRNNEAVNGVHDGHSPATVTDTKAVIRYLRNNADLLPAGNTERIIITGTSGGGALSTLIAASGNSSDFFPSLFVAGAAGIEKEGDTYTSTISDDVYGVIAYCPITDLANADAAYEWTFKDVRAELKDNAFVGEGEEAEAPYTEEAGTVNEEVSELLAAAYEEYVNSLGLKLDDGSDLTADNLKDAIIELMEKEITVTAGTRSQEDMLADIAGRELGPQDWLVFNEDGTFTYDYDKHLQWVVMNKTLKVVNAFSNEGLPWESTNEDNLFGTAEQDYSPFEFYSWENNATSGNGVGTDDTGLSWNEYLETEAGQYLLQQLRMSSSVAYLNDQEGTDASGIKAPHWYVRYGMYDRDSSFALETILRYSISNNADIEDYDFGFAWLQPHMGDYDVQEAYAWLDTVL